MNEIKSRTVYKLVRTDKPEDGTDVYVGSTSLTLKKRLCIHRSNAKKKKCSKLYTKMNDVGIYSWEIIPLLTFSCDQKTIREFERQWCETIGADLNMISAFNTEAEKREHNLRGCVKYYSSNREIAKQRVAECRKSNKQNKVYHCNVCDKSFESNSLLKRHLDTLKHSYAYMNSPD